MAKDENIETAPDLEIGNVFKDYDFHLVCSVWLAKFIQEVANKKGGRCLP